MQTYWMKFKDGTEGFCQGQNAYDAVSIAEKKTGKVADVENKYRPDESENVQTVPYPVFNHTPRRETIWIFEHPTCGKTPTFCGGGRECIGKTACPISRSCCD